MTALARKRQSHHAHRGMSLIIVMVMMLAISLVSLATMKSALTAEHITHSVRLETLAKEAAQAGLRHCERMLEAHHASLQVQEAPSAGTSELWTQWSTWHTPHAAIQNLQTDDRPLAQCMVEKHPADARLFIVTARGFSPGYESDAAGNPTAGASIWVQSTVNLCGEITPCSATHSASPPTSSETNPATNESLILITDGSGAGTDTNNNTAIPQRQIQHRVWRQILNSPHP